MLIAESIQKSFPTPQGPICVLSDICLTLSAGQSAAIMGPSGCGKSTLLNIMGTLEAPSEGSVRIGECDPFALDAAALAAFRNERIGFVFQEHHLLPQLSVLENVLLPTLARKGERSRLPRAKELLDRVGLSDRLEHRPAELSGGERQRVAIARALIHRPAMILADEPTGNLDSAAANDVCDLLMQVHADAEAVLIVVTHSVALADRFDARYDLVDGKLSLAMEAAPDSE